MFRKLLIVVAMLGATLGAVVLATPGQASAATCIPVVTSKGPLTAAVVDASPPPNTVVDATGCDIGIYYDITSPDLVGVTVQNATQYGVFVDGVLGNVTVNLSGNNIHNIGDVPFNGVQHGVAVYYYGYNTVGAVSGTVDGNAVSLYQKGGIVVSGTNANVTATNNTVTGLGPVPFIAQNGIQFGFGATGTIRGNSVSNNYYTGCSNQDAAKTGCTPYVSTGILLFDINPNAISTSQNHFSGNQRNLFVGPEAVYGAP